jgi:competence protein ComEC
MIRACLSLLAGIYALQLSSFTDFSDCLRVVFVAAIFLLLLRQFTLALGFLVGALLFLAAAGQLAAARIAERIEGDSIVVNVQVIDFPEVREDLVTFLASPSNDSRLPARIRLSWFAPPVRIHMGDNWQLELRLRRPRGYRNPGGFDYEAWLFRERIAAVGYVVDSHRNHLLRTERLSPVERMRIRVVQRIGNLVDDPQGAAVLMAIIAGARHEISREQWERYAATGSSHLVAISGLHIGLSALGTYYVLLAISGLSGAVGGSRNHHLLAIACALLGALLYAQVAGFAIPARRASLMLIFGGVCVLQRRETDVARILATAALLLAMADPLASMMPGFILSFAAVAILLWSSRCRRIGLPTLQVCLFMGLLPLTVLLFDRISFAAFPVNLVAVPVFSLVIVPLAFIGMLCDGPIAGVGDQALRGAAGSVLLLDKLIAWFAATNWASMVVPTLSGVAFLYLCLPVLWVLLPGGWPGRQVAWLGIVGISLYQPEPPPSDCVVIAMLDVGQGLAVVLQTHGHTVLYDTGPAYRSGGSAAETVIVPFARSRGIDTVDRLLVSHADLDHAGGVAAIVAAMPVQQILAGEPLTGVPYRQCRAGQRWVYDGVSFSVLSPGADSLLDGNDRSCVLLVEVGDFRVLLTGDIERAAEDQLVSEDRLPSVQAVTVPHHGSRTSSTRQFVNAVGASIALVSAAHGNRWGFPKEEVVQRWQASGATVLNTADSGAVELLACRDAGLKSIRRYRVMNHRIWHE